MGFGLPITIKEALAKIQNRTYAMPAIQREFVWSEEQIVRLFDSIMQGYPIGQFLFWEVDRDTVRSHRWYGFVLNYHEKSGRHNPMFESPDDHSGLTAVLDGQQRLTALNIGLRGSYASKLPRLHRNNPNAYPSKQLYMNIDSWPEDDDFGTKYGFKFLTDNEFKTDGAESKWFKVSDIMETKNQTELFKYLTNHRLMNVLSDEDQSRVDERVDRVARLWDAIYVDKPISFFLEEEPELDKVLNIFVRTNSGGTVLSNSDLLLSITVAQFKTLDARHEVNERTDELNEIGDGFRFSRDFVLKAGLVLADINSVRFNIRNFDRDNVQLLEDQWVDMTAALRSAVELASQYGLSGGRLSSQNALLPIAYYLYSNRYRIDDRFLTAMAYREERETIRRWLYRTLIGRVWGGGSDSLLERLRTVIREHGRERFPVQALTTSLAGINRSIVFDGDQLDDIVDTPYGPSAFVLLSMLYPFVNVATSKFHVDHVFPRSMFARRSLERAGLGWDEGSDARERGNRLANLQLLEAPINASKGNMLPRDWLQAEYDSEIERQHHADLHQLDVVPADIRGFVDWYDARRKRMLDRLRGILGQRPS